MYVIINSHHEEEWRIPDNAHIDAVDEQVKELWIQIAERFEKYGDHLIFEGLNEPRVKGGQDEWNGGTQEVRECVPGPEMDSQESKRPKKRMGKTTLQRLMPQAFMA